MGRPKIFLPWLFNSDKLPLYVKTLAGVSVIQVADVDFKKDDGLPAHLDHSDIKWRDTLVKFSRNIKYGGIFREYNGTVSFVKDGAFILKNEFWDKGIEGQITAGWSKLNRASYPLEYDPWYACDVDFSKFRQTDNSVDVALLEGGPTKYLKAYESATYEIPIGTDPDAKVIHFDGLPFSNKIQYSIYDQPIFSELDPFDNYIGMGIVQTDGTSQGVLFQDQPGEREVSQPNTNWFMSDIDKNVTLTVTGTIYIKMVNDTTVDIFISRIDSLGTELQRYQLYNTGRSAGEQFAFDVNETIVCAPGETLHLKAYENSSGIPTLKYVIISESNLSIAYEVKFNPTFCLGLTLKRYFTLLWEKISEGKYTLSSTLLDQIGDSILITSGTAIRDFGATDSSVKMSFDDAIKSIRGLNKFDKSGVMVGVAGNNLIIEKGSHFYQNDVILNLGEVDNFEIENAEDLEFNTIKNGYPNQTYDSVNGRDEFNVTQQWTTPIKRVIKEFNLVSVARADMYGIELTRLSLYNKDTTDSKSDNDPFLISVVQGGDYIYYDGVFDVVSNVIRIPRVLVQLPSGASITIDGTAVDGVFPVVNTSFLVVGYTYITVTGSIANGSYNGTLSSFSATNYKLNRPAFTSITGVLHPDESFNTLITSKEQILNNGAIISAALDKQGGGLIKFQTGDKNSELSTTLGGVTLTQKENIAISSLAAPLYRPYYMSFNTSVQINYLEIMNTNPYGRVVGTSKGRTFSGFLDNGGINPATNDKQKWRLVCDTIMDLNQFKK